MGGGAGSVPSPTARSRRPVVRLVKPHLVRQASAVASFGAAADSAGVWVDAAVCAGVAVEDVGAVATGQEVVAGALAETELVGRPGCPGPAGAGRQGSRVIDGFAAVSHAHDHAFPGWRNLPLVRPMPEEGKARARWLADVQAGWLERGGPVLVDRGGRSHSGCTPWRGYDLTARLLGDEDEEDD